MQLVTEGEIASVITLQWGSDKCSVPQRCASKCNLTFKFVLKERRKKRRRARAGRVMDVSLGLFDELIESCAPSSARLSAANDGLLSVNGTNAPATHLTGKSVFQSWKGHFFRL